MAASQSEDAEEPWATYIQLWQAILLPPDKPNKATAGSKARTAPKLGLHQTDTDPQQLAAQQQAVYDALMRAVMDAMRNLDLEYHQAQIDTSADVGARVTSPDSTAVQGQVSSRDCHSACTNARRLHCASVVSLLLYCQGGLESSWAFYMPLKVCQHLVTSSMAKRPTCIIHSLSSGAPTSSRLPTLAILLLGRQHCHC